MEEKEAYSLVLQDFRPPSQSSRLGEEGVGGLGCLGPRHRTGTGGRGEKGSGAEVKTSLVYLSGRLHTASAEPGSEDHPDEEDPSWCTVLSRGRHMPTGLMQ